MFVAKYTEMFKYLTRFYTLTTNERWRCQKFKNGLKHEIGELVVPLSIRDFPTLIEKVRVLEKLKNEGHVQKL